MLIDLEAICIGMRVSPDQKMMSAVGADNKIYIFKIDTEGFYSLQSETPIGEPFKNQEWSTDSKYIRLNQAKFMCVKDATLVKECQQNTLFDRNAHIIDIGAKKEEMVPQNSPYRMNKKSLDKTKFKSYIKRLRIQDKH